MAIIYNFQYNNQFLQYLQLLTIVHKPDYYTTLFV